MKKSRSFERKLSVATNLSFSWDNLSLSSWRLLSDKPKIVSSVECKSLVFFWIVSRFVDEDRISLLIAESNRSTASCDNSTKGYSESLNWDTISSSLSNESSCFSSSIASISSDWELIWAAASFCFISFRFSMAERTDISTAKFAC